eukprot:CAMPEP_0201553508 /NCGR_PEP_ID=MMETSP0173_2-20130828/29974_1 /ASSEMBLY_ACC=CAM_ASM_000268 /TAXON_ID=218659 /ORGANISM="Vexillifera sp., Strain DIVA3 564/2" /LENGTH=123 /DNA_ID=CAMNT_0047964335 /DNA_START=461 /DNA_END=828 /DNA_ORIENTATION=+
MLIVHPDHKHVLLGRQSQWPTGMWSALAGFVDHGETLQEAVVREVKEESSLPVDINSLQFVSSQPWPFPISLMLGFIGHASAHHIQVDQHELSEARWFSKDEVIALLERSHKELFIPPPYAIA